MFYLYNKSKAIAQIKAQVGDKAGTPITSVKVCADFLHLSVAKTRFALLFLKKLQIVETKKVDHTFDFFLSSSGIAIIEDKLKDKEWSNKLLSRIKTITLKAKENNVSC